MINIPKFFYGEGKLLTAADFVSEAAILQCKVAIIHAFSDIESSGSGFISGSGGLMSALFEAKAFGDRTGHKYDNAAPNISSLAWNRALYGPGGIHQWERFSQAYAIDPEAAMLSMSIGRFQVMGFNYKLLGYKSVENMYVDYAKGEGPQLVGFGAYISGAHLLDELRADPPKFTQLSVGYNGQGERQNGYDQKLETSYYYFAGHGENYIPPPSGIPSHVNNPTADPPQPKPTPLTRVLFIGETGDDVLRAQQLLAGAGLTGVPQTGRFDAAMKTVVQNYQRSKNLLPDGEIGPLTGKLLGF